ncbi:hypothetical protein O6H91_11G067800 [Diphasiastrum complanatum]|uniref:Uncharacterized protein n=1 Tax=Diphasiastrum complanatum TaxID=34168 RepID=A0ACC2CA44_DIPCM|nr:hypothetical protein O6H91_11G067800 [Diphasiastrum complanatum]
MAMSLRLSLLPFQSPTDASMLRLQQPPPSIIAFSSIVAVASSLPPSQTAMPPNPPSHIKSGASFLRPHLLQLAPYTPIEPFEILSARLGRSVKDIVKLDANENLYGPPPEVLKALGCMDFPNIYPDPESRRLRAALEVDAGVEAEHILVGCGADELIDLIMRCTLDPGDKIIDCPPTFTMYAFDAAVNAASVVKVPRLHDFRVDVEALARAVKEHSPKIVFLTSPNNPDGRLHYCVSCILLKGILVAV